MAFTVTKVPKSDVDTLLAYANTLYGIVNARVAPASELFETDSKAADETLCCMVEIEQPTVVADPRLTTDRLSVVLAAMRKADATEMDRSEMDRAIKGRARFVYLEGEPEAHAHLVVLQFQYKLCDQTYRLSMVGCGVCGQTALRSIANTAHIGMYDLSDPSQAHASFITLHPDICREMNEWLDTLPAAAERGMEAGRVTVRMPPVIKYSGNARLN